MNKTSIGNRTVIGIFGKTNSGKSAVFNKMIDTDISIVSEVAGTTTDPVKKAMELIPFGPVQIIDTAGLNDDTKLGEERIEKTMKVLELIDLAVYIVDGTKYLENKIYFEDFKKKLKIKKIPYLVFINKKDIMNEKEIKKAEKIYLTKNIFCGISEDGIKFFKNTIIRKLNENKEEEKDLLKAIVKENSNIVLVTPIDSSAPKGRLILPQVQVLRSAIDNKIIATICDLHTLEQTLKNLKKVDLVITDSQVFKEVNKIIGDKTKLTSFSILMARQKGDIKKLIEGILEIEKLVDGSEILIAEVCTHNVTHEDIARKKIPKMLKEKTNKEFNYTYYVGSDYPENLDRYDLIIHCGGCMITPKQMKNRITTAIEYNKKITNFGLVIAYCQGILKRSIEILD